MKPAGCVSVCEPQQRLALLPAAVLSMHLWTVAPGALAEAREVVTPPVEGLVATLEDEVRDLSPGRIAWATHWKLCWTAYSGAKAYELQRLTAEGSSRTLRHQTDNCLRIEAAKGENDKSQGLVSRDLLLVMQGGQLAYRVRAVLDDNRVSAWSRSIAVGQVTRDSP